MRNQSIIKFIALLFISNFCWSLGVQAESEFELTCRSKAKELAAKIYKTCMTDMRSAHIENLKKNYQSKLNKLKEDYERDIEKLGGKSTKNKKNLTASGKKSKQQTVTVDSDVESSSNIVDESIMDIPEPIPVETPPSENSN